jgi:hypothetical protein
MDEQAIKAHEIDITCPKCFHRAKQTLGWLSDHGYITCSRPGCGAVYPINKKFLRKTIQQLNELPIGSITEP